MERVRSVFCVGCEKNEVFSNICEQIDGVTVLPSIIIFFSDVYNFKYYSEELKKRYTDANIIGSTSYINFCSNGCSSNGLSAMVIYSGIECSCGVLNKIDRYPLKYIDNIYKALDSIDSKKNTCCLEFTTAFSNGEELVQDTFKIALKDKNIPVFGGSAGASLSSINTFVSLNGIVYENATVFIFLHNLNGKIFLYRENIFKPIGKSLVATDVDPEERVVYGYNDRCAADVLAEKLEVPVSSLQDILMKHPVGRVIGNDIYISESGNINKDGSIKYFSRIYNLSKLELLEADDIDKVWKNTCKKVKSVIPTASFSISINCLSRTRLFESQKRFDDFVLFLKDNYGCFIGLSGYGEQLDFVHLNQTMIIACFE